MRGVRTAKGSLLLKKPRPASCTAGRTRPAAGPPRGCRPASALTELIPSWEADHAGDSSVQVAGPGPAPPTAGRPAGTRWPAGRSRPRRPAHSAAAQSDDLGRVTSTPGSPRPGHRVAGAGDALPQRRHRRRSVRVDRVGAMASAPRPRAAARPRRRPARRAGTVLDVPRYSQMIHSGQYPQYGGGGEAWCSPTSTTMVLGLLRRSSPRAVRLGHRAATPTRRSTTPPGSSTTTRYGGTGNWAFNTAYAASHHRRRLRHPAAQPARGRALHRRRHPAGRSRSPSARGQLNGAPISSTNGHLLVIVGFQADGDVVVNDPAAPPTAAVRRTYDRGQFEDAWINASGGLGVRHHR